MSEPFCHVLGREDHLKANARRRKLFRKGS